MGFDSTNFLTLIKSLHCGTKLHCGVSTSSKVSVLQILFIFKILALIMLVSISGSLDVTFVNFFKCSVTSSHLR